MKTVEVIEAPVEVMTPEGALGPIDLGPDKPFLHIFEPGMFPVALCGFISKEKQLTGWMPGIPHCPDCERIFRSMM